MIMRNVQFIAQCLQNCVCHKHPSTTAVRHCWERLTGGTTELLAALKCLHRNILQVRIVAIQARGNAVTAAMCRELQAQLPVITGWQGLYQCVA